MRNQKLANTTGRNRDSIQAGMSIDRTHRKQASMKLIVAIVQDYDTDALLRAVSNAGFGVTRIGSTGGFLRSGNTTVLLGVNDDRVTECTTLIRQTCRLRLETVAPNLAAELAEFAGAGIAEVQIGGAVIFVANVSRFERL